jgi:hypothetical protein
MNNQQKALYYATLLRRAYRKRNAPGADETWLLNIYNRDLKQSFAPTKRDYDRYMKLIKQHLKAAFDLFLAMPDFDPDSADLLRGLLPELEAATNGDQLWAVIDKALGATRYYKDY